MAKDNSINYQKAREELDREFVMKHLAPKWKEGQSLRQIAEAHNLSHEQVRLLLKKYGITK